MAAVSPLSALPVTFPDFNSFPFGLIDHIDILKDGASPIYGTDAVSGVVNVYLIHQFRGVEILRQLRQHQSWICQ